jgi:hypothetical protein
MEWCANHHHADSRCSMSWRRTGGGHTKTGATHASGLRSFLIQSLSSIPWQSSLLSSSPLPGNVAYVRCLAGTCSPSQPSAATKSMPSCWRAGPMYADSTSLTLRNQGRVQRFRQLRQVLSVSSFLFKPMMTCHTHERHRTRFRARTLPASDLFSGRTALRAFTSVSLMCPQLRGLGQFPWKLRLERGE